MFNGHACQTSNQVAAHHPIRSMALLRPAAQVMGWTAAQKAAWNLAAATTAVASLVERFADACADLGQANRVRSPRKRLLQGRALRTINTTRAQLKAARRDLVAAQMAMAAQGLA